MPIADHQRPDRFAVTPGTPTMKAVVTRANGGFDVLDYVDVPIPTPGPGEVLLQVLAAGVNNTEINTRLGWYSSSVSGGTLDLGGDVGEQATAAESGDGGWNEETPFPFIQGTDCCGRVVELGSAVGDAEGHDAATTAPEIGRRVLVRPCVRADGWDDPANVWMASDFDGAFAQYVVVPASEVFAVECEWSDAELGSIPCAYGTAENMLHRADVGADDHVLVTGASGGVGSATVQLARRRGATVTAVAGTDKVEAVAALGADRVIPRAADLLDAVGEESVDVAIDNVAGDGFGAVTRALVRGGRYASSGAIAGPIVALDMRTLYLKDLTLIGCTAWDEPVFPNLIGYIEQGEIEPVLAKTFALEHIVEAQRAFLRKEHVGKFVLLPPPVG
ncbi:MAG: alcohol dehydrogenase family protein [Actinomycetota bacterium]